MRVFLFVTSCQEPEALYQLATEDLPQFSKAIAGDGQSDFERTKNIVT